MAEVTHSPVTRRALLLSSAAALGCGRRKATAFPGYCLVANQQGRSVAVVDLNRFRLRKTIPLEAAPAAILAHPDPAKAKAYVLAAESGSVYEIDAGSLAVSRGVRLGGQLIAFRAGPRGDALWALCREPASLIELRLDTFRPARRIAFPAPPDAFDLSEDGLAAISSRAGRAIYLASLAHGKVERTLAAQAEPSLVAFRWDGRQLIAGSAPERSLTIFDTADGKTMVRLPLPLAPQRFCFNADHGQLFITGDGMDAVVIAFPYTTEVDQTILAGRAPGAMAITNNAPYYLLISNPADNAVTVLDVDTRRLVAVAHVGQGPGEIVITPDQQYALVLNEQSGDVAVIRRQIFSEPWVRRYKSAPLFTMIPVGGRPVGAAVVRMG